MHAQWTALVEPDREGSSGGQGCAIEAGPLSFDDFVRRHQAGLVRYAALLSGSRAQADDHVQEVLIRVYRRWPELTAGGADPLPYVRRAVSNEHLSWRRRWHTRHVDPAGNALVDLAGAVGPLPAADDEALWGRVQALPRQQRAAVLLRYHESLTDAEIAEVLGCREVTVRAHISRGLARLRVRADLEPEDRS